MLVDLGLVSIFISSTARKFFEAANLTRWEGERSGDVTACRSRVT